MDDTHEKLTHEDVQKIRALFNEQEADIKKLEDDAKKMDAQIKELTAALEERKAELSHHEKEMKMVRIEYTK